MRELHLTQNEADILIAMNKTALNADPIDLPDLGGTVDILLHSEKNREEFIVNYTSHCINLFKRNHNFRARKVIGLVRLDLDGPPHRNQDGQEIGSRHLHTYREGFGLKWAKEIPKSHFSNLDDSFCTLEEFLKFCNVIKLPNILKGLFS